MKYQVGQRLWYVPNRVSAYNQPKEVTVDAVGRKWVACGQIRFDKESGSVDGSRNSSPGRVYASREEYERIVAVQTAWSDFVRSLSAWFVPSGMTAEKIEPAKVLLFSEEESWTDFEKCQSVIDDAVSGNGSVAVRCISAMLGNLMLRHGAQFTIDGAIQSLDEIVKYAEIFKRELNK